jgi:tyrosine-protein phosphatase YwqE
MYKDNLLSYIASDMHNIKNRPNDMGAAFSAIAQADCLEAATKLCISIPNSITKQIDWQ